MRAAIIGDGVVTNMVEATPEYLEACPHICIAVGDNEPVSIGYLYDGSTFSAPTSPPKTAEQVRAEINAAYSNAINVIADQYPDTERDSWAKQEAEARAYLADNNAATPLLSAIATARGITVDDLAARVVANADAYTVTAGEIIGRRQARMDEIAAAVAANDIAALQAVVW